MTVLNQIITLVRKNLLIIARRHWISAVVQALVIPVVYIYITTIFRNFFLPPSEFGFGEIRPIRNLTEDAFPASNRNRVVFVHNNLLGGQVEEVINGLASSLRDVGADVQILPDEATLNSVCRSSLIGTSNCYAAATFYSSIVDGPYGLWNYTVRVDASLGRSVYINSDDTDPQIYTLPFIHAINRQIAAVSGVGDSTLPEEIPTYPYTDITAEQRSDNVQRGYMTALENDLALVIFIGVCVITFHMSGFIATEREIGMSQLIDSMVPNRHQWQTQVARLAAAHVAFDIVYFPGWIAITILLSRLTFYRTSYGIIFGYHFLVMLALSGWASLGGSFFRKAQLSGILVLIVSLALAVVAQLAPMSNVSVGVLSFLFPSMNYTFFTMYLAAWEGELYGADLTAAAPLDTISFDVPGYIFFVGLAFQILLYPTLAALSEWWLYGTGHKYRHIGWSPASGGHAVELRNFSKHYHPSWWVKHVMSPIFGVPRGVVKAVDDLSMTASKGEMIILLGSNGSGKTTTLDCISGVQTASGGSIELNGSGGLGLCPQKNVMWGELTVEEHVFYFNRLKSPISHDTTNQIRRLVRACDLDKKLGRKAKTLSGGQRRKLQLAMAFTGGSKVVCVDEVSSGLDPVSRRKIWEILLAQRGERTFLFTTHALDEAEAIADQILVLSMGSLKVRGSVVELKHKYGGGYRLRVHKGVELSDAFEQIPHTIDQNDLVLHLANSGEASDIANKLDSLGVTDYEMSGPTIEDVFLNLVDESKDDTDAMSTRSELTDKHARSSGDSLGQSAVVQPDTETTGNDLELSRGKGASFFKQTWILLQKRFRISTRNFMPYLFALIVPVLTAGLASLFLTSWPGITCDIGQSTSNPRYLDLVGYDYYMNVEMPVGPESSIDRSVVAEQFGWEFSRHTEEVQTYSQFMNYLRHNYGEAKPGGFFLGTDDAVLAYVANGMVHSAFALAIFESFVMGMNISMQFSNFFVPLPNSAGDSIQLILYFGFAMCCFPAFFALYPTFERLQKVKALQYSNGIRPEPLWLAHLLFDFMFVVIVSGAAIGLFSGLSDVWYEPGYLFAVFILYGVAATLMSYVTSLFAKSQLIAFACVAGYQAFVLLIYFVIYLLLVTFTNAEELVTNMNTLQYTLGLISPSASLLRSVLLTLNQSQLLCRNQSYVPYAGDITVFGAPILYLVLQSVALYAILVWHDSGRSLRSLWRREQAEDEEADPDILDDEVAADVARVERSDDGLRILHLSKKFGRETAVDNLTFGVKHGEVFGLLGPNGAGKSTTISMIRGDIRPSSNKGDALVENHSIRREKAAARQYLGVCPQFDAIDQLTVTEHLKFYARACGVRNVNHNVSRVIKAVGLDAFKHRMAGKLSGGNKRKLSLGIAIVGNPSILLLDEPSSGMDVVAKRGMWTVLRHVKSGRSLVITTHSMEEVSALADRSGIMAKRMLATGTTESLCRRYGDAYYVHLVHKHGPSIAQRDVRRLKKWFGENVPTGVTGDATFQGQLKFVIPRNAGRAGADASGKQEATSMIQLLRLLEQNKEELGLEYYSITQTTLEDVFLNVIGKAGSNEEK